MRVLDDYEMPERLFKFTVGGTIPDFGHDYILIKDWCREPSESLLQRILRFPVVKVRPWLANQ